MHGMCSSAMLESCGSREANACLTIHAQSLSRRQAQEYAIKRCGPSQLHQGAAMGGSPLSPGPAWLAVIALMATSSYSTSDTLKSS